MRTAAKSGSNETGLVATNFHVATAPSSQRPAAIRARGHRGDARARRWIGTPVEHLAREQVVICDRAGSDGAPEARADGIRKGYGERLGRLECDVTRDVDRDEAGDLTGRNREGAGCRSEVGARGCRARRGRGSSTETSDPDGSTASPRVPTWRMELLPSTTVALPMPTIGPVEGSSSRIVPVADAVPIVAPVGAERLTTYVSFPRPSCHRRWERRSSVVVAPARTVAVPDVDE